MTHGDDLGLHKGILGLRACFFVGEFLLPFKASTRGE